jgi:hypothetical protein
MANAADDFTRADETKDNGTSGFAEQSDLHAAFGKKENFLDGIASEEHGLATGNLDGTAKRQNFGVVSLGNVHKQLGQRATALGERDRLNATAFGGNPNVK